MRPRQIPGTGLFVRWQGRQGEAIGAAFGKALSDLSRIHERYERVTNRLLKAWADDPGHGDWWETRRKILDEEG